jgi:hypothetical protein
MAAYGYDQGNPFGDPNSFTRSTGESELNRYNEWMRSQPEWQQARGTSTGDFNDTQKSQLEAGLAARGITVPKDFHIDEGGNFNQKSRAKKIALYAALAGGAALTGGLGLAGMGPLGGVLGGTAAVPGAVGGTLASTTIGTGMLPAIAGGTGLAGGIAGGTAATTAAATAGIGSKLAGLVGGSKGLDAAGKMIGAYGETAAGNRGTKLAATMDADLLRLKGIQDNREGQTDALAKLANANYLQTYKGPTTPSKFGYGPTAPSDAQRAAAKMLEQEMLARLHSGGFTPTDTRGMMDPGKGERLSNILGPLASFGSRVMRK